MENINNKKELILIAILTILIATMDITGIPCSLFLDIHVADIEPIYFSLMLNFVLIGIISFLYLKLFCPTWKIGLTKVGFIEGIKKYGIIGAVVALVGFVAFYFGQMPLNAKPSVAKVLIEGAVYYIGVAIVEEFYVRGLLLNFIEKLFIKSKYSTFIAVVLSSVIFGLGHMFGMLNESPLVIVSRVIWTIGMGLFFGLSYKRTGNLWVPILFHFLTNVCALPYCFSSVNGYADLTLYIILPLYLLLGAYSLIELRKTISSQKLEDSVKN